VKKKFKWSLTKMVGNYNSSPESLLFTVLVSVIVASPFVIAPALTKGIRHPTRLKADLASFSAGIFLGAVTFSIIKEAVMLGDILTMGIGFGIGSVTFSVIRYLIQKGTKLTEKSSNQGSGQVVILGTLVDSHPETIMIGIIIALGISDLLPTALALFTGNFTATVVGTRKMLDEEEKSKQEVTRKWAYVFIVVAIGGLIGYFLVRPLDERYLSIIFGFAAGALISFVTEELIPEAYKKVNWHIGLSAALGLCYNTRVEAAVAVDLTSIRSYELFMSS
jgi:ZIP family zinc transporter